MGKNSRKIFSIILVLTILFDVVVFAKKTFFKENLNVSEINDILESEPYAYLSPEAKNYIKGVYERTGNIILTEKNKKENELYLNPQYVEYLSYSEDEKKEVSAVPNELIVDYISNSRSMTSTNHESYYNMSEPDNNYITPMKNQRNLGICWAYAIVENAESFLMKTNNTQYEEGETNVLSARQLDYVTSSFGIEDYVNKYGDHTLGTGSNFQVATKALTDGISFYESSWKYNNSNSLSKLELSEVFNDSLSKFELNSTIEMPILDVKALDLSNPSDLNKYDEYISKIKDLMKVYGGPYIGSYAPGYSCSAINVEDATHHIIDTDSSCERDGSHSMQIVGWDDNYKYKYCINGSKHIQWTSECTSQNTVIGTGAWIVRNSWGDDTDDKFTYLTYNSIDTEYDFITSLENSENRKWNYIFSTINSNMQINRNYDDDTKAYNYIFSFFPSFNVDSKIIKIKYRNVTQNNQYKIYISESGYDDDYILVNDSTIEYPGYVTIDLSSENYKLTKNTKIKIICNTSLLADRYFSVFTSEETDNKYIVTKDKVYEQSDDILDDDFYKIHLFSNTYNIAPNSEIEYRLFDQDGNDITTEMRVENNVVSSNMINTSLYLPDINDKTYFTVKTVYDGNIMSSSRLTVDIPKPSLGSGTVEDPYVIMTPQDLYSINYNMDSHFVLGDDIDLTYDTQNENGLYYNSGNGWAAIGYEKRNAFTGSINGYYDGKIHKIIGLKTNSIGFLFYVDGGKKTVNLKNIIFENAIVNNSNLLAYKIVGGNEGKVNIENIAAINSTFLNSSNLLAYSLQSYGKDSLNINSIFTDGTFNEGNGVMSGLAWGAETYEDYTTEASINISNVQILGKINNNSLNYTALLRFATGNIDISNVIFNNYSNKNTCMFAKLSQSESGKKPNLKNIYYLNSVVTNCLSDSVYTEENNSQKTIAELKNISSFEGWNDFNNYWILSNEDGLGRIPILNFIPFRYTIINDINLKVGETVNIYDYISPSTEASHNVIFENLDDDNISLDSNGMVTGLNYGTASIHVLSNYDGLDDDITVNVLDDTKTIIRFNSNDEFGLLTEQIVTKSQKELLNKNSFIKNGYKFKEWNTQADGSGTSYNNEQEVVLDDNLILYAQWQPIKYYIIYYSNDSQNNIYTQDIEYDSRVLLNENSFIHENDRFYFKEWNTKADGSGVSYQNAETIYNITNIDGDIINLYAQWGVSKPVISFDANGGTGTMNDIILDLGETVSLENNSFERIGYSFGHWNTKSDDSGTSYYNKGNVSTNIDLKLYAIWYPINYSVFWYNADQTKSIGGTNKYDVEYTASDYKWTLNEGYKFKEWNTATDGSGVSYKAGDTFKNLTTENDSIVSIYAIVLPINYKISFDANGGTGKMDCETLTYDLESNLIKNTFTRNRYIFKEWNTKADGSGNSYSDEQSVKNLSNLENDTLRLYAIWEPVDLPIGNTNYHLDGDVLTGIGIGTNVDSINLMLSSGYSYSVYDGDSIKTQGNVGTGNNIKIYQNSQYVTEYTVSVKGDINGDGDISVSDVSMIYKNLKRKNEFSSAQSIASDVNGDEGVSVSDISMIYKHIKRKINLGVSN